MSQPVAAAQLVLVTAAEGQSLVGASNFASKLPLAATGKLRSPTYHAPLLNMKLMYTPCHISVCVPHVQRTISSSRSIAEQ